MKKEDECGMTERVSRQAGVAHGLPPADPMEKNRPEVDPPILQADGWIGRLGQRVHSTAAGRAQTPPSRKTADQSTKAILVIMKVQHDNFGGLFGRGFPSPLYNGVLGGLRQHRAAAEHLSRFDLATGGDRGFHSNGALKVHLARKFRIEGRDLAYYFTLVSLRLVLRTGKTRRERRRDDQRQEKERRAALHNEPRHGSYALF